MDCAAAPKNAAPVHNEDEYEDEYYEDEVHEFYQSKEPQARASLPGLR